MLYGGESLFSPSKNLLTLVVHQTSQVLTSLFIELVFSAIRLLNIIVIILIKPTVEEERVAVK
jgi:hypothetical protein